MSLLSDIAQRYQGTLFSGMASAGPYHTTQYSMPTNQASQTNEPTGSLLGHIASEALPGTSTANANPNITDSSGNINIPSWGYNPSGTTLYGPDGEAPAATMVTPADQPYTPPTTSSSNPADYGLPAGTISPEEGGPVVGGVNLPMPDLPGATADQGAQGQQTTAEDPFDINKLYGDFLAAQSDDWATTQQLLADDAARRRRMASAISAEMGGSLGGSFLGGQRQADIASQSALMQAKVALNQGKLDWLRAQRDSALQRGEMELANTLEAELNSAANEGNEVDLAGNVVGGISQGILLRDVETGEGRFVGSDVTIPGDLATDIGKMQFSGTHQDGRWNVDVETEAMDWVRRQTEAGAQLTAENIEQYTTKLLFKEFYDQIRGSGADETNARRNAWRAVANMGYGEGWDDDVGGYQSLPV